MELNILRDRAYKTACEHGNVLGEKEWKGSLSFKESIVAWMPIPEFKKGE